MLKDWIDALINKVEELEHDKNILAEKILKLEAIIRNLQVLPAKPMFKPNDKTSELNDNEAANDDDDDPKNITRKNARLLLRKIVERKKKLKLI